MLQTLIVEHDNLLQKHEILTHEYEQSVKTRQELNIKYAELINKHISYKNKYMKIRRHFECICILYVITGGFYYINLIESQIFHVSTVIVILLSLIMS